MIGAVATALVAAPALAKRPTVDLATLSVPQGGRAALAIDSHGARDCSLFAGRRPATARRISLVATGKPHVMWSWRVGKRARPGRWTLLTRCADSARRAQRGRATKIRIEVQRRGHARRGSRQLITPSTLRVKLSAERHNVPFAGRPGPQSEEGGRGSGDCPGIDGGGYCLGNCTHYAWTRRPDLKRLGNAEDWLPRARAQGIPTGSRPVKGAVAWWDTGAWGHVAYVEDATATTVTIREMNYVGFNVVSARTLSLTDRRAPRGYIYGGPAGAGPGAVPPPTIVGGAGNIFAINRRDSGSGKTAVHILDAARGYQAPSLLSIGTWLHQTDSAWDFVTGDYDRDGRTDVFAVNRSDSGSGKTAVHVLDGANRFQAPSLLSTGTWLHPTTANWTFASGDYNRDGRTDIFAINKTDSGSGKTAVHVLDGANRFQAPSLLSTGTWLHQTDANWDFTAGDYNGDGRVDIYAINKKDSGSGRTAVHVLDGANKFQSSLLSVGTWLHQTDASWDFTSADFNRDGRTDILAVNKSDSGSGKTAVHVLNAANRFQAPSLLSIGTWLHPTGDNWAFVAG